MTTVTNCLAPAAKSLRINMASTHPLATTFSGSVLKPAAIHFTLEHPSLVQGHSLLPTGILPQPLSPQPGENLGISAADSVPESHTRTDSCILAAASRVARAAELTSSQTVRRLQTQFQEAVVMAAD
eukprot:GFKZ01003392.1.p1 GENE.GFKZ01003392.1~~GFKZ01003392.1.p1  ORF type:complete len:127 (-),score=6.67 GFKZ01003392.1:332-712(-)